MEYCKILTVILRHNHKTHILVYASLVTGVKFLKTGTVLTQKPNVNPPFLSLVTLYYLQCVMPFFATCPLYMYASL